MHPKPKSFSNQKLFSQPPTSFKKTPSFTFLSLSFIVRPIVASSPYLDTVFTMTYNSRQRETLLRLGIKQLPTLQATTYTPEINDPFRSTFVIGDLPVRTMPVSQPWKQHAIALLISMPGSRSSLSSLCSKGRDRVGHSWKALPTVWNPSQLRVAPFISDSASIRAPSRLCATCSLGRTGKLRLCIGHVVVKGVWVRESDAKHPKSA